jgi:hypothetical protein
MKTMATNKGKEVEKSDNNTMVVIHLDRPRFIKFGHKALKTLGTLTGKKLEQMDENDFDLAELEKIMWCGLQADAKEHGEDLKIEDMEDLLDKAESFGEIMEAMNKAFEMAFKKTEKQKN